MRDILDLVSIYRYSFEQEICFQSDLPAVCEMPPKKGKKRAAAQPESYDDYMVAALVQVLRRSPNLRVQL